MLIFRGLRPDEIQVRINNCTARGATYLLYKDARCDQDILDETVGPENWQRRHAENKGNLFCEVGINTNYNRPDTPPNWVWKQDCGAESNTEKEKGEASDSFKRACVNWGIGRELYTKINIFIPIETKQSSRTKPNGKPIYEPVDPYQKFTVSNIQYDGKKIVHLEISDGQGIQAFEWSAKRQPPIPPAKAYICETCGKEVRDYSSADGKRVSAARHASNCAKKFGKILCLECISRIQEGTHAGLNE